MVITGESREEVKKAIMSHESGIIEFRSYFNKTTHQRIVSPKGDGMGWFLGVPKVTDEMKASGESYVDPKDDKNVLSSIKLEHKMQFDLADPRKRMMLEWMFECDRTIALTYEEGAKSPKQTFYVFNEATDVNKRTKRLEVKDTAVVELSKLAQDDLHMVVRLMGYRMSKSPAATVKLFIRELFEDKVKPFENCEAFLKVVHDKNKALKAFGLKAMDTGVITKSSRGEYKYKEIHIGLSEPMVFSWLGDKENKDFVLAIKEEVDRK